MTNEELYLKSRVGDKNPFRVPEGYFDSFAAEMMQKLPEQAEQPRQGLLVRMRPWMYAAACMVVAIFTATLYFVNDKSTVQQVPAAVATTNDTYVEDVADYVMVDNLDIYNLLASEY